MEFDRFWFIQFLFQNKTFETNQILSVSNLFLRQHLMHFFTGLKLTLHECRRQFHGHRWNCSHLDESIANSHEMLQTGTVSLQSQCCPIKYIWLSLAFLENKAAILGHYG